MCALATDKMMIFYVQFYGAIIFLMIYSINNQLHILKVWRLKSIFPKRVNYNLPISAIPIFLLINVERLSSLALSFGTCFCLYYLYYIPLIKNCKNRDKVKSQVKRIVTRLFSFPFFLSPSYILLMLLL